MLADPETGRQREVVTTPLLCREFAAAAAAHRERVALALRRGGRGAPAAAHRLATGSPTSSGSRSPASGPGRAGAGERRLHRARGGSLGLLVVAVLAVAYVVLLRRRRRDTLAFTNLELLDKIAPKRPGWYRHIPAAALLVALALLTVALAGPQAEARVPRNRATVVLVIDVSLSMQATDVAPSRLAAAQAAAKSFADQLTPGRQPRARVVRGHRRGAGLADHRPGADQARGRRAEARRVHRHRRRDPRGAAVDRDVLAGPHRRLRRRPAARPDRADVRRRADGAGRTRRRGPAARGVHRGAQGRRGARAGVDDLLRHRLRHDRAGRGQAAGVGRGRRRGHAPHRRAVRRAVLHRGQRGGAAPGLRPARRADRLRDAQGRHQQAVARGRRAAARRRASARASGWADGCRRVRA